MTRSVVAELGYLDDPYKEDDGCDLHYYADFTRTTNARLRPAAVTITDARTLTDAPTLDGNGFTLARWATAISDFIDTEAISDAYIAECEALIRQLTGCDKTAQAGPIHCRFDRVADPRQRYDGRPAHYVHADYSPDSAQLSRGWLPPEWADFPRVAVYNVWRVLTPPPQSRPLALCDTSSLRDGDECQSRVILAYPGGHDVEFHTQLYHPRPWHRWFYYSDMVPEEVLVFSSFDTARGQAGFLPHCAFADPNQPTHSARMSIEARVWAGFH